MLSVEGAVANDSVNVARDQIGDHSPVLAKPGLLSSHSEQLLSTGSKLMSLLKKDSVRLRGRDHSGLLFHVFARLP